jgi:uncharacterized protein YlxW (UPF0749 family)
MDKKQKEALVLAMLEKGESYRSIAQKAKLSPNTIKAISNRAGLDETTSISSRAFELYSQQRIPPPLEVAIKLDLKSEDAIRFHQEYFMLLGCTEFTKAYLQVKDNPWPFIKLVNLFQKTRIGEGEVIELLRIANGYLPRVRLEYDRVKEEKSLLEAELNSWKAELSNTVRTYQDFCDRNLKLKKREDELQLSINKLEAREKELQKTTTEFQQHVSRLTENNAYNTHLNQEVKQEGIISTNDVSIPPLNAAVKSNQNEKLGYHTQTESSYGKIFDTKDFF